MQKMNKKGMSTVLVALLVIVGIIAVAGVSFVVVKQTGVSDGGAIVEFGDCEEAPYLEMTGFNASFKGDLIGTAPTYHHEINGFWSGTMTSGASGTDFIIGDTVRILAEKSDLISKDLGSVEITKCGKNELRYEMDETDVVTLTLLTQNLATLTDSTSGAVNLTASANPINMVVRLDGVVDKNTGNLWVTIETNTTQVDKITASAKSNGAVIDADATTDLELFADEFSGTSIKYAFVVESIQDGGQADYNVKFTPESGITMGGDSDIQGCPVYVNVYSEQAFVETDGSFTSGIENSEGTLKYEDTVDRDTLIE